MDPAIEAAYPRTRPRGGELLLAIRGTTGGTAVAGPELVPQDPDDEPAAALLERVGKAEPKKARGRPRKER
ncbi:MAG: hypothetical protein U1F43_11610 [Myxococcota bacterium]